MRRPNARHSLPGPDDIVKHTLANGVTILTRENFASPAVVINGYLEAGTEDEPHTKAGLASFTGDVLERGTTSRSFSQLYEEVESVGATFGVNVGNHLTSFGGKGLAEELPLLMDILSDVLRNPAFESEQVEKARNEILTTLQEREYSTRRMASLLFREITYPDNHPYHYSVLGYPETVKAISRDDLVNFHQQHYSPQGLVIVVVGAVKSTDVIQAITKAFGDWEATRPEREPMPPVPELAQRNESRVNIPDKTQSDIILGWPGPQREHPDYLKCRLTNTVLGVFGMMGRLGTVIREKNGMAYYVYSSLEGGKGPGAWRVAAGVNASNEEKAIALIRQEIRRIQEEVVPEEELNDSKAYLSGILPLQLETNEGVAGTIVNMERYNLGLDYVQRYRDMVSKITTSDLQAMAQKWMNPDNFALAIAGPEVEKE